MSNVTHLMKEYFDESEQKKSMFGILTEDKTTVPSGLPVRPDKFEWKVLESPERFFRQFEFEDRRRMIDFIDDILGFEDDLGHHGKITINHQVVDIEVNTKIVESITNLDQEYIKGVNEILKDVEDYRYEKNDRR